MPVHAAAPPVGWGAFPLSVSPADGAAEHAAGAVADQVMRGSFARRVAAVSQPAASTADSKASAAVSAVLHATGRPLDADVRSFMESRFGRDLGHIQVHDDSAAATSARSLHALAYTAGHHIVSAVPAAGRSVRGRQVLAHELAHVVQQGAATAGPGPRSAWRIQRFTEAGHKLIGDTAFGPELLSLGDVQLTFGDAVALGDYFGSFEWVRNLAAKPGIGRGTQGELRYVLWVKIRGMPKPSRLGKWYDEGAAAQAEQTSRALDSQNASHFPNPRSGDTALDPLQKNQRVSADGKPLGAAATYRQAHEEALRIAYLNGAHQRSNDDALLADGFACHFLTDSFSASHLRTARTSIKAYWDAKVPGFKRKLIAYLADHINRVPLSPSGHLDMLERAGAVVALGGSVHGIAEEKLEQLLSGGDFSFGDVVSLIVHDAAGHAGVDATIEGKPLRLVGDKDLVQGSPADPQHGDGPQVYRFGPGHAAETGRVAVAAVRASLEDIYDAYLAGLPENLNTPGLGYAGFGDLRRTTHHQDFETFKKQVRGPRGLYRAERLMPTAASDVALPAKDRASQWAQGSVDDLLAHDAALEAFGRAEVVEFEKRVNDMEGLKPEHRAVLRRVLIERLKGNASEIRGLLKDILAGPDADLRVGPSGVSRRPKP